ncbi:MAG TPA: cation:proton antiporter [Terriglobales bacterium]|nr:cation:proton antiporter [Terriglobales bacterium]
MPHGSSPLLLNLFLIFVLAKLLGEIFERLRLPAVLGEILAGVVFGPYALAWVAPDQTIHSVAELGAIFLLFTVGLETHPKDLIRVGRKALGVALAGVIVPFALGFAYMMLRYGQAQEATFVAAAMVATSVGITARVLGDMKVLQTRAARIILGAAVFDDILAMILLAVVAGLGSAGGVQWLHLGILFAEAVAFALFMIFIAPRVIRRVQPRLEQMAVPDAPLLASLALCLGLSVAAEKIGMAAIIGAFFAGLAFAEYSPQWNLQPRVHAINEFLAPFFFFTMGTRLDLHAFTPAVLISAVAISILALISKIAGCGLPVLREGWRIALRVGVGMMPRGEVGLIVALVGLNLGAITQSSYAIVIFMTAVTTLLAPPALRVLFRREEPEAATD